MKKIFKAAIDLLRGIHPNGHKPFALHVQIFILILIAFSFFGCSSLEPEIIKPEIPAAELAALKAKGETLEYQKDIQPILDRRCVTCHSCYNSPCQLKMTSFEGLARGATKKRVYNASRIQELQPTRLFIDAKSTEEWRKQSFADVTGGDQSLGPNSFMYQLLDLKECNPEIKGTYDSEARDLTCSQTDGELKEFMKKNPHAGMPFGFPEISKQEKETLMAWLAAGAKGPDPETDRLMKSPSNGTTGEEVINRWEKFLNEATPKMITTARYLYEHLFLAHIHFDEIPGDYFLLVRSRTPWPAPIDEIPTVKPYDDPGVPQFYYRFQKIHSTIVFKTHILYRLNDTRMDRYRKLFLDSEWQNNEIIVPSYEPDSSANPFRTFQQIPARSRYQFLLDDSQYFFMSFIRGPVCTGQLALNVINDHFWVIFLDPDADLSLADPQYLNANIDYLKLPTEARGRYDRLFYVPYLFARNRYILNRTALYKAKYPNGLGLEDVWAGDDSESNPFLTIYRHFDSATVSTGPVGGFPRTGWVIDFPLFERLYYNLVAGFNVFSNIKEQVGGRNYMDLQRKEAELLLLNFMPPESRAEILKSWYPTFFSRLFVLDDMVMLDADTPTQVLFPGNNTDPMQYKNTFFTQIIDQRLRKDIGYQYDPLNFHADQLDRTPAKVIATEQDLDDEFRKISHLAGTFVRAMPDKGDVAFVRFVRENREDLVYTVILNRYHENVAFIKGEDLRLDEAKNTIHVVKGFVGSYPNAFFKVNFEEAPEFFKMFRAAHDTPESFLHFFEKFGIKRSAPDFWEMSDFFNDRFMKDRPLEAGYFDLNRYINDPQPPSFWDRLLFTLRKEYQTGEALPADCPAGF